MEFAVEQTLLRLGRKRVHEFIEQADPESFAYFSTKSPIETYITSNTLLALVLSRAWRDTLNLSLVCKRFSTIVRLVEYWKYAVETQKSIMFPHAPPKLLALFNPFYQFPQHVPQRPKLDFREWLRWLFYPSEYSSFSANDDIIQIRIRRTFGHLVFSLMLEDEDDVDTVITYLSFEDDESYACEYHRIKEGYEEFLIFDEVQKVTWMDAILTRTTMIRWCGSMKDDCPVEGKGFYKN